MFKFRRKGKSEEKSEAVVSDGKSESKQRSGRRFLLGIFSGLRHRGSKHGEPNVADAVESEDKDSAGLNGTATGGANPPGSPPEAAPPKETLSEEEVRKLFSGAPHFSTTTINGQLQSSAAFPWDIELRTRDVSDAKSITHVAFSGATLRQHLAKGSSPDRSNDAIVYDIGVKEMPSMLAATGTEPGSVGFQYFLEEPVADALSRRHDDHNAEDVFEHFNNFELLESEPEKLGIRKFDLVVVRNRLIELGEGRTPQVPGAAEMLTSLKSGEEYAFLFGKLLTSPKYDANTADPTGLKAQIETLIKILNLKRVWYDFSDVEWRIRIGQLLFTDSGPDLASSGLSEPEDGLSERDVVLLQVLLACELYIRLETIARLDVDTIKTEVNLTQSDVARFYDSESRKTKWDLVLARRFLDEVKPTQSTRSKTVTKSHRSLRSMLGMPASETTTTVDEQDIAFLPRRQEQQLKGLFEFQRALAWPGGENFEENLAFALAPNEPGTGALSPSIYATPLSTPGTMTPRSFRSSRESGYFAISTPSSPEMTPRSFQLQPPSAFMLDSRSPSPLPQPKALIGGWLTRSYLTGLIMPGEAISHLLISAILENDADAITALGENANLYGGFVYKERSFWSKSCVVGRVIACLPESKECMGWVSSTLTPEGYGDGWLDVHSVAVEATSVEMVEDLENRAAILGTASDVEEVKLTDLSLPQDPSPTSDAASIELQSLRLQAADTGTSRISSSVDLSTTSAVLAFSVSDSTKPHEGKDSPESDIEILPLKHLVQFISAFPCTPPQLDATKRLSSGFQQDAKIKLSPAHPLHNSYQYRVVHASELLSRSFDVNGGDDTVTVVDARGQDSTLELLARSWCSSEGFNALIARVRTTCLGCAVREARGLGVGVVVRIGDA